MTVIGQKAPPSATLSELECGAPEVGVGPQPEGDLRSQEEKASQELHEVLCPDSVSTMCNGSSDLSEGTADFNSLEILRQAPVTSPSASTLLSDVRLDFNSLEISRQTQETPPPASTLLALPEVPPFPIDHSHPECEGLDASAENSEVPYPDIPAVPNADNFCIRNLDTGEQRRLGDGALRKSFVELPENPDQFSGSQVGRQPWTQWWTEKRVVNERLWVAAESGSLAQLQEALAAPKDGGPPPLVNSQSLYGRTTLHIAASVGKADCVELLLDNDADVNACTDSGLTSLHIACQRGHLAVTALLLDWDAEVYAETNDRNLPIHFAAGNGHTEIVVLLLEYSGVAAHDALFTRNSMGQRPAEVALDFKTAEAFRKFEVQLSTEKTISGKVGPAVDHYAGRMQCLDGTVLPHNARADIVSRLLHKTRRLPDMSGITDWPEPEPEPLRMGRRPKKATTPRNSGARQPFTRVSGDGPNTEKVGPDSFEFVKRLGKGSFGEVFHVKHRRTQQAYAMKLQQKSKLSAGSGTMLKYAETERNVLSYIHHPYIMTLYYAFQTTSHLVLVMQYCPSGNLQQLIAKRSTLYCPGLDEPLARLYTSEMLLALIYLHERCVVFRDLKPENVVLDEAGHSVLTDFGLAKEGVLEQGAASFCGSAGFLAPEVIQRKGHGCTVDVYGLGVLLFSMLTGSPPFWYPDRKILFINIQFAELRMPRHVSWQAASLIESLMERDPASRLGAKSTTDVKRHCFFASTDFDALLKREVDVPGWPFDLEDKASRLKKNGRVGNPFHAKEMTNNGDPRWGDARLPPSCFDTHGQPDVSGWSFAAAKDPTPVATYPIPVC